MDNKAHNERIHKMLKDAGMTSYGFLKLSTAQLPNYIHPNEHIGGVVYGRTADDKIGSAMLIATDRRIIFLDAKPFYTSMDEVSYDVVSGIKHTTAGPFSGVSLHTRVRDYSIRYANKKCATNFIEYIESHIERDNSSPNDNQDGKFMHATAITSTAPTNTELTVSTSDEYTFLRDHDTAVLSTVDREGNAHSSVIHYAVGEDGCIYFITKDMTAKSDNIVTHGQVSLLVHETGSLKTLQLTGQAEAVTDAETKNNVFRSIVKPRNYKEGNKLPPVAKLSEGKITTIRITPQKITYKDFSTSSW